MPSAYMEPAGTIRAGISTADPYAHSYLSVQAAEALNVTLRQTAEISSLRDDAKRLYPGIDLKLRLAEEDRFTPEISLGLMGATGHRRMAGEYLALSKRFHDFTMTGGLGWGRYGGNAGFKNPLGLISTHFDRHRDNDGNMPNGPKDWFTGSDIGLFGGVEYAGFIDGLSVKLDYGADHYSAEKSAFDYDAPAPWAIGLNYSPVDNVDLGLGLIGGQKIMATLNLKTALQKWPGREQKKDATPTLDTSRIGRYDADAMQYDRVRKSASRLFDIRSNKHSARARMEASPGQALPRDLGRAARNIANHAGKDIEEILITPNVLGLNGPTIRIMRKDLEQAVLRHQGSPQEIWRKASLNAPVPEDLQDNDAHGLNARRRAFMPQLTLILDTQMSLSEEDSGILYRTGLIADLKHQTRRHWVTGASLRLEGPDNLDRIGHLRPAALFPVRSDIAQFAKATVSVERLYNAYLRSFGKGDWHVMAASGYLEEMYAGFGGEILYRPHGKTYALGAEAWQSFRREPDSKWGLGLNGDHVLTGHLKTWYEIPETDLTIGLKAGRYLGQDLGGTLSLTREMQNGVKIEAFATATNRADFDLFGGTTHLYSGLRLTMPLGNVPYVPRGSHARLHAAPMGRDMGQVLDSPLPLYDLTTPFSYRAIASGWNAVTD